MRGAAYSEFLSRISGLMGLDPTDITTSESSILNGFFNRAIRKIWESNSWLDVCPYGEVRFIGNKLNYPNDLTQSVWTGNVNGLLATANVATNPLDGRVNASQLAETVAFTQHFTSQVFAQYASTNYSIQAYVRPNGRQWVYLRHLTASGTAAWGYFDLINGIVGFSSSGSTPAIAPIGNGFFLCQLQTTSAAAGTVTANGTASLGIALTNTNFDPGVAQYTGDSTKGIYAYGIVVQQTSNTGPEDSLIPYEQLGESGIDVVFDVLASNPMSASNPRRVGYTLTSNGIQIIGAQNFLANTILSPSATISTGFGGSPTGGVYLYYRQARPIFSGNTLSLALAYAAGTTVYYTTTAAAGTSDYYKCIIATAPGQTPDTNPLSWQILTVPYAFFEYCVYSTFANWLRVDGQSQKAQLIDGMAEDCMMDEADKMERQNGQPMPLKVATHLSQQSRRAGSYTTAGFP